MHRLPRPKLCFMWLDVALRPRRVRLGFPERLSDGVAAERAKRLDRERPWRVMNQRKRLEANCRAGGGILGMRWIRLTEATRRHVRR